MQEVRGDHLAALDLLVKAKADKRHETALDREWAKQLFATDFGYYDYACDLADTAHFVAQFAALADHLRQTFPAGRYTEIHYERFVADQEVESRRLIDFMGLE